MTDPISPDMLLRGYAAGIFPMANSRASATIHWIDPKRRGIIPLDNFHISKSLKRAIRRGDYQPKFNSDFEAVVAACAERPDTWINGEIETLYSRLHQIGHAHAQEIWAGSELIGGVYGVTLGRAFFGESMFSTRRDTSKIALAYLVHRLRATGFCLFDTQFITPHLASLGGIEISRHEYLSRLRTATQNVADIMAMPNVPTYDAVTHPSTQTS